MSIITDISSDLEAVDQALSILPDDDKWLLDRFLEARELRQKASELERSLEGRLAEMLQKEKRTVLLGDGRQVESLWRAGTTHWDQPAVISTVIERAAEEKIVNESTGEVLETELQAIQRVVTECLAVTPRTTALKRYDINPNLYRETDGGRYGIKVSIAKTVEAVNEQVQS